MLNGLARRKGGAWYLGGITNWTKRAVDVPLNFLPKGNAYAAKLYVDGSMDEGEPNAIREEERDLTAGDKLRVELAPGGGVVGVVTAK